MPLNDPAVVQAALDLEEAQFNLETSAKNKSADPSGHYDAILSYRRAFERYNSVSGAT